MTGDRGDSMKRLIALAMVLVGASTISACGHPPDSSLRPPADFSSPRTRIAGEYLVTLVPGADVKVIADLYACFGIKGIKDLGHSIYLVILSDDPGPATMEALSGQIDRVKEVQPNFSYRTH
jgi:hypothetical protein